MGRVEAGINDEAALRGVYTVWQTVFSHWVKVGQIPEDNGQTRRRGWNEVCSCRREGDVRVSTNEPH